MPWQVKPSIWLKTETDKVEGIILLPKYWSTVWTEATLRVALEGVGVTYSAGQITLIGAELLRRGILEAVV